MSLWINPVLESGWSVGNLEPRYAKCDGVVHIQGTVNGGGGALIFSIPQTECHPPARLSFPVVTDSGIRELRINSAGNVIFPGADTFNGEVNLNISYRI